MSTSGGSSSTVSSKGWWFKLPVDRSHGYQPKAFTRGSEYYEPFVCVKFCPFGSHTLTSLGIPIPPKDPSGDRKPSGSVALPSKDPKAAWRTKWIELVKEWEDVVALGGGSTLMFLKVSSKTPLTPILIIDGEDEDDIRCIAWSYDVFTLSPIVAFAGANNLIYIWTIEGRRARRVRVLKGHGDTVHSLSFHPTKPHLLLSTSQDMTLRIWNITAPDPVDRFAKINCAMGEGEEGPLVTATYGTHDAGVRCAAWHPGGMPVIVSGGADRAVKIWALPPLPPVWTEVDSDLNAPKIPSRYFCVVPLFSSSTLHDSSVDSVFWYNNDTIISQSNSSAPNRHIQVRKWKWLSYHRHFPPGGPIYCGDSLRGAHYGQMTESRSYHVLSTYSIPLCPVPAHDYPVIPIPKHRSFAVLSPILQPTSMGAGISDLKLINSTTMLYLPAGNDVLVWNVDRNPGANKPPPQISLHPRYGIIVVEEPAKKKKRSSRFEIIVTDSEGEEGAATDAAFGRAKDRAISVESGSVSLGQDMDLDHDEADIVDVDVEMADTNSAGTSSKHTLSSTSSVAQLEDTPPPATLILKAEPMHNRYDHTQELVVKIEPSKKKKINPWNTKEGVLPGAVVMQTKEKEKKKEVAMEKSQKPVENGSSNVDVPANGSTRHRVRIPKAPVEETSNTVKVKPAAQVIINGDPAEAKGLHLLPNPNKVAELSEEEKPWHVAVCDATGRKPDFDFDFCALDVSQNGGKWLVGVAQGGQVVVWGLD